MSTQTPTEDAQTETETETEGEPEGRFISTGGPSDPWRCPRCGHRETDGGALATHLRHHCPRAGGAE